MALQQTFFNVSGNTEKLYSFEEHMENKKRFYNGEITNADEIRTIIQRIKAAESVLKAELSQKTLKQLCPGGVPSGYKKADVVKYIYDRLLEAFMASDSFSWSPFSETKEQALDRVYAAMTDESLAEYLAKVAAERAKKEKALNNPETLEGFREFVYSKGEAALSPEQKIRFDELLAEKAQEGKAVELAEKAEIQAVQLEGVTMSLIESRHTKKDVPLWVVQISERVERETYTELNRKAKMLGGWYSSFNKAAAGFQFYEKDQAEKFMGLQSGDVSRLDYLLQKEEDKKDNSAARLRESADNLRSAAEEKLNADRKVNTHRRANMAASAEASAHADLYLADTMDNLAGAIESGEAKHLNGVKYKTHVETLHSLVRCARDAAGKAAGLQWDKIRELPITVEHIEHAAYPYPAIWKERLLETVQFLSDKKGAMRLAQKIKKYMSVQKVERVTFRYEKAIGELKELLTHCRDHYTDKWDYQYLADALENYNRVQDMGLTTEPMLRAALREFLTFRGEARKTDPIKEMERELIGQKIPGYFPTPGDVVDRLLELADIKPGMAVLEPSAGKGNIADAIREAVPGVELNVCEINHTLQEILRAKGHTLAAGDCKELFRYLPDWDRIVMNPPFENGQDIEHVQWLYKYNLKEGGRLVAIMSEGPFFRSDSQAVGFRSWLDSVGGRSEKLPEGSFKNSERSTGVNTRIVVINK